jgi:septal ring factor EnvC (AmiA/AmiB activator)
VFLILLIAFVAAGQASSQESGNPAAEARRLDTRIRSLQREADQLARSARTLVNELRALEIERDLRSADVARAETDTRAAVQARDDTSRRLAALERERVEQLPGVEAQLVELYKRGAAGYLPMLVASRDLRDFGRASRALAALGERDRRRIARHEATLAALRRERDALEARSREALDREAATRKSRTAAQRAVGAHAARLAEIDGRRDLWAQYVGELQVARDALLRDIEARSDTPGTGAVAVPLPPFRGSLDWPVPGQLSGRFGQAASRLGGSAVRNGIEIAAALGTPVRAVHGGRVVHAEPFTGLGTLVIIDHGSDDFSLYGYLGAAAVAAGQDVPTGAELGQVGNSPAGPAALYFEMRIDGRAVDPVQWLEPR